MALNDLEMLSRYSLSWQALPQQGVRPLKNALFWPISASDSNCNPRNIHYIPVVEIFVFLDLDQISADFETEHFSKVSV